MSKPEFVFVLVGAQLYPERIRRNAAPHLGKIMGTWTLLPWIL
jgi:hypothetical protein